MIMDPHTGELYPSLEAAKEAGVDDAVEITGSEEAIKQIQKAVIAANARKILKKKRKMARASRKANRG
jgi:hypothetical protein